MTKAEFIDSVASKAGLSKKDAGGLWTAQEIAAQMKPGGILLKD